MKRTLFLLIALCGAIFITILITNNSQGSNLYADCKQQICVILPNGSPAVNHHVHVYNSAGTQVIADFYTGSSGCFPGPGLPNFTVGLDYDARDVTEDGCAAHTRFTACVDGSVVITFCHN